MLLALLAGGTLSTGCGGTATPERTAALKAEVPTHYPSSAYSVATIMPFTLAPGVTEAGPDFGENFAGDIVARLRADYPGAFGEVRWNKTNRVPGEVLVEGTIRTYKPGSVVARAFAIPLAASFDGEVSVRDPADDRILLSGSFDKFWVLGGTFDSKAIDNLVAETSEAIAKTLALWRQGRVEGRKR